MHPCRRLCSAQQHDKTQDSTGTAAGVKETCQLLASQRKYFILCDCSPVVVFCNMCYGHNRECYENIQGSVCSGWRCPCSLQVGWTRLPLKIPSNPKHSLSIFLCYELHNPWGSYKLQKTREENEQSLVKRPVCIFFPVCPSSSNKIAKRKINKKTKNMLKSGTCRWHEEVKTKNRACKHPTL